MVRLGMGTGSVATALDLEEGLAFLDRHVRSPAIVKPLSSRDTRA
jgi:hypothetical protein